MKFYFVRHGKASFDAASDEARPLTDEGNSDMQKMAAALAAMSIKPKRIYHSPRKRAVETAQHIQNAVKGKLMEDDLVNFDFDVPAVQKLVKGLSGDSEIMFVGHNPSISQVVEVISGAQVDLPAGAVVCIDRVQLPTTNSSVVQWILTPDAVNAITD